MLLLACQAVALAKDGNRARNRLSSSDYDDEQEHEKDESAHRYHSWRLRRDWA